MVYPGHDYKGDTVSTIAEERHNNPRLQVQSAAEYAEIMNNLNLANPAMMDVAVPENLKLGLMMPAQHRVPVLEVDEVLAAWPVERQPPCPRATTILAGFQAAEVGVFFGVSG